MEIWIFSLSLSWLLLFFYSKVRLNSTFRATKLYLVLFILFVVWVFVQTVPLPVDTIAQLSPETFKLYQATYQLIDKPLEFISISHAPLITYNKFLETLSYFLLFCLLLLLLKNTQRIRLFATVIVFSGVFQALYGTIMSLSGLEYGFVSENSNVATGTFINRNHLAGYLEMTLAVGIGLLISNLYQTSSTSWREFFRRIINSLLGKKARLRIGLALMVIALVLTHSRMGNSAFFTSMSVMSVLYIIIVKKKSRSVIVLFASLLIIDMFIVGAWFGIDKVAQRIKTASVNVEKRDEVNRDGITMIKDYALVGTGGGTYSISFLQYRGDDIIGFYNHAHNDYIEFATEYGVIAGGTLALMVFISLFSSLRALRQRNHALLKGMAFSSAMGIMAIAMHATVDFNLQIPANATLFIVLLALGPITLHLRLRKQQ